jgi:plastocyanin
VSAALHIIAASEPSKVPFYVAGGLLAAWAVVLSAYGLSRAEFPSSTGQERAVIGISVLLVVAAISMAVATSSFKHEETKAEAAKPHGQEPAAPGVDTTKTAPAPSGGTAPAGGGGGGTIQIAADPGQLKFDKTTLSAKAGSVKVEFNNPSPIQHDFTVESGGSKVGGTKIVANGKATATVDLKAGTYTFYCSVDAHRQAGMEGKLTVS